MDCTLLEFLSCGLSSLVNCAPRGIPLPLSALSHGLPSPVDCSLVEFLSYEVPSLMDLPLSWNDPLWNSLLVDCPLPWTATLVEFLSRGLPSSVHCPPRGIPFSWIAPHLGCPLVDLPPRGLLLLMNTPQFTEPLDPRLVTTSSSAPTKYPEHAA